MAARFAFTDMRQQIHKQRRLACKECRQRKIRCNAAPDGSVPCSRCRHLGKDCQIDTRYKRVNKRHKVDELEEQLNRLRSVVETNSLGQPSQAIEDGTIPNGPSLPQFETSQKSAFQDQNSRYKPTVCYNQDQDHLPSGLDANITATSHWTPLSQNASTCRDLRASMTAPRSIDGIFLDSNQIDSLFSRFFQYFNSFLEILDPKVSANETYNHSPLLFWAIISIASRHYEEDPGLLTALSPSFSKLLWSTAPTLPHTRWTLIGMLLISLWPSPTSTMWKDPSFMLISMTRSAAMQMGLHRPELVQDFSRTKSNVTTEDVSDAAKIWSACFIIASGITSAIGFEPLFADDRLINRACQNENPYKLPTGLWHDLMIQRFCNRVQRVFADRENMQNINIKAPCERGEHFGILNLLEQDLLDLESNLKRNATELNHISLSCAHVQLRIFYFFDYLPPDFRKHGLLKAFQSASTLIVQISHADASSNFIRYCPASSLLILTIAAMILLKILNSSYARYVDVDAGRSGFNTALCLLRRGSVEDNDVCGKASKILAQLWSAAWGEMAMAAAAGGTAGGGSGEREPALKLQTRLGASILHDTLWKWRQDFGDQETGLMTPSDAPTSDDHRPNKDPANVGSFGLASDIQPDPPEDTDSLMDFGFSSLLPVDMESYFSDLS